MKHLGTADKCVIARNTRVADGRLILRGRLGVRRQLAALHPVGHIGEPEDVGDVVVWLASDQARFVTGQVITVDGGRLSRPPLPDILD